MITASLFAFIYQMQHMQATFICNISDISHIAFHSGQDFSTTAIGMAHLGDMCDYGSATVNQVGYIPPTLQIILSCIPGAYLYLFLKFVIMGILLNGSYHVPNC